MQISWVEGGGDRGWGVNNMLEIMKVVLPQIIRTYAYNFIFYLSQQLPHLINDHRYCLSF